MLVVTRKAVADYLRDDWVLELIRSESRAGDERSTVQRWHLESAPKRLIHAHLYGDLLHSKGRSVLDIGGGLWCLTRRLAERHDYILIDILAHDQQARGQFAAEITRSLIIDDWHAYRLPLGLRFDVVIANDLFPNVDQRLALFLDKFLPVANEIRLSLTYYNQPRFYRCRSLTSEEIFCMLAWDGEQTARTLMRYREQVVGAGFSELERQGPSLYENGRQVCLVTLRGPTE